MWRFPESCRELPKETICLNWGYLPDQRENEIRDIAASGITQYACPGCCGWNQWMPLLDYAYRNNRVMCRHARKYGAIGLLNNRLGRLWPYQRPAPDRAGPAVWRGLCLERRRNPV